MIHISCQPNCICKIYLDVFDLQVLSSVLAANRPIILLGLATCLLGIRRLFEQIKIDAKDYILYKYFTIGPFQTRQLDVSWIVIKY